MKNQIIVIGGPTASGKTELALKVAKEFNGEMINADSMQVYRGMDIGTNKGQLADFSAGQQETVRGQKLEVKPFDVEGEDVTGWLFDLVNPDYNFSVSEYQKLAYQVINDIWRREKLPILVGGTGLYIDSVTKGYDIDTEPDVKLRKKLNNLTVKELKAYLVKLGFDINELNESDRENSRRLIRMIEKTTAESTEKTWKARRKESRNKKQEFNSLFLYPEFDKGDLFKKIDNRAKKMIEEGLIGEVKGLVKRGYNEKHKAMQATGYKQVLQYLAGEIKTKEELIEKIQLAHRQYAKRQITWFEGEGRGYDLVRVGLKNVLGKVKFTG